MGGGGGGILSHFYRSSGFLNFADFSSFNGFKNIGVYSGFNENLLKQLITRIRKHKINKLCVHNTTNMFTNYNY